MKRFLKIIGGLIALIAVAVFGLAINIYATALTPSRPVGFQQITVADPGHTPIVAAVWYPTTAKPGFALAGLSGQRVASNGPVEGDKLPLVVFSHGTAAAATSHADTAIALAERGFIVIAPTHAGDNFQDGSDAGKPDWFVNRSRHVERSIDAALATWKDRGHVDASRIGVFGFSAGATTALINIGGKPDLSKIWDQCATRPEFICKILSPSAYKELKQAPWHHDPRIRAAVLAAPGIGFAFNRPGLSDVDVPVQLWAGSRDTTVPWSTNAGLLASLLGDRAKLRVVPGATHYSFLMPCGLLAPRELCQDARGFDRAAFHHNLNAAVVQFFSTRLSRSANRRNKRA